MDNRFQTDGLLYFHTPHAHEHITVVQTTVAGQQAREMKSPQKSLLMKLACPCMERAILTTR